MLVLSVTKGGFYCAIFKMGGIGVGVRPPTDPLPCFTAISNFLAVKQLTAASGSRGWESVIRVWTLVISDGVNCCKELWMPLPGISRCFLVLGCVPFPSPLLFLLKTYNLNHFY